MPLGGRGGDAAAPTGIEVATTALATGQASRPRASTAPSTPGGAHIAAEPASADRPDSADPPAAFAPAGAPPGGPDARDVYATAAAARDAWSAAHAAAEAAASAVDDAPTAAEAGDDAPAATPGAPRPNVIAAAATAVAAFDRFGAALPALADRAALGRAEALDRAGDDAGAADAYATAAALAGDPATAVLAHIRIGNARLRAGDAKAAAAAYEAAAAVAADDGSRAQALAGLVAAAADSGDVDKAAATRLRLVRELPASAPAAVALERLREAGVPVTAVEEAAVARAQGDPERADALLAAAGVAPAPDEAAWRAARAEEAAGRGDDATAAYAAFAERFPDSARVAEAHWRRAWLALAADDEAAAIAALDDLFLRRPDDARAGEAGVLAGVLDWQAGRRDAAVRRWTDVAAFASAGGNAADAARAHLWLAKAAEDAATRRMHERAAIALDPLGDAAARVAALVAADTSAAGGAWGGGSDAEGSGDATGDGTAGGGPDGAAGGPDGAAGDDAAVAAWLARWAAGADDAGWSSAQEAAAHRLATARAAAWLGLGERAEALAAWRAAVREAAAPGDRLATAVLARDLGLPSIASSAAEQVLARAPAADRAAAPAAVLRLAYPIGWPDEVAAAGAEQGVPTALLAALVRQESRWDPAAVSGAGARGLTQVMPATGHGIAGALGVAGFDEARLDDPATALRFGAQYLGVQLRRFDGRDAVALAAYNAGPGNAAAWWAAAGGDVDAFLARIAFPETRRYVRGVIAAEAVYRRLGGE